MKTRLLRLLNLLLVSVTCAVLAAVLVWESMAFGDRAEVLPTGSSQELAKAGLAGAPLAMPVIVYLRTVLGNR